MCCIIDSFISDLFTLVRQLYARIRANHFPPKVPASSSRNLRQQQTAIELRNSSNSNNQTNSTNLTSTTNTSDIVTSSSRETATTFANVSSTIDTNQPEQAYRYKMMSKKGLLKFVKYTLIFSNAFGFILSIFLGLFGIAYPDKHFPLSYKGREMALCSLFCMLFTTIGYCGAQNHRRMLLIIYGATNIIIVIIVVILWFLFEENSILGNKEISNMFITTLAITIAVMFLFSFILAFHIQTFKENTHDSIISQSQQLIQQTTAFLQQQQHQVAAVNHHHHQQQHQQQAHHLASTALGGNGNGHEGSLLVTGHHHQSLNNGHRLLQHHMAGSSGQQLRQLQQGNIGSHLPPLALSPPPPVMLKQSQQPSSRAKSSSIQQQSSLIAAASMAAMQLPPPQIHSQALLSPPSPPPPQVPVSTTSQQPLMRNQSSPLPGINVAYQQQQCLSQGTNSRSNLAKSNKTTGGQHYQAQKAQQQASQSPDLHQHSMREHHRMPSTSNRLPSCPVQYCTFQCDRTV